MTTVIGLSGKARHGKGSVVQLAQIWMQKGDDELEVRQVSFATALKQMAADIVTGLALGANASFVTLVLRGLPGNIANDLLDLAIGLTVDDLKAKTPQARKFLQFLGTEAFRVHVDDLYWVKLAAETIKALPLGTQVVFVPDCRFPNEADYVRAMGGEIWRIERLRRIERWDSNRGGGIVSYEPFDNGLTPEQKAHRSEVALDDYQFDVVLRATNMDDLFHAVEGELKRLGLI